jgi:hypothetical protein
LDDIAGETLAVRSHEHEELDAELSQAPLDVSRGLVCIELITPGVVEYAPSRNQTAAFNPHAHQDKLKMHTPYEAK